tara:strand:+ start:859 stop:1146 length:288 start_codon:yes stop_codon:yes gene_type:complete
MDNNICGICCEIIEKSENTILKCGHNYHYNCIELAYKYSREAKCPYCRQDGGKLVKKKILCSAIIKTGKNKGKQCLCKVIGNSSFCGRHNKNDSN